MISKQSKIKLAKMLQLVSEIITDKGVLYSDTDLQVGEEVFVYDENDNLVVAPNGEYTTDKYIYVVTDGKLTEIKEFQNAEDSETENVEESNEGKEEQQMENEETEQPEEETHEEEETENLDELKAQIEELQKQLAEKDEEIAKLNETIAEYKEKEGKSTEEPIEEQEEKMSKQERGRANVMELLKSRKK